MDSIKPLLQTLLGQVSAIKDHAARTDAAILEFATKSETDAKGAVKSLKRAFHSIDRLLVEATPATPATPFKTPEGTFVFLQLFGLVTNLKNKTGDAFDDALDELRAAVSKCPGLRTYVARDIMAIVTRLQ